MPQVPRYDQRVKQEPVPGVRVTPGATEETFGGGAGVEKIGTATREIGQLALKMHIAAQDSADKTLAEEQDILLTKKKNEIINTVNKEYRGSNAVRTRDYIDKEWNDYTTSVIKDLPNDRVKSLVAKKAGVYYGKLDEYGITHTNNEYETYSTNTMKASVASSIEDAALNWPDRETTDLSIFKMQQSREKWATEHGIPLDSEQYKLQIREDMSDLHKAKIEKMLSEGADAHAEKYYTVYKKDILGKDADAYGNYIQQEKGRLQSERVLAKKLQYDETNRALTLKSFNGDVVLSEVQRLYKDDLITESDYNAWENKLYSDDYRALRRRLNLQVQSEGEYRRISDASVFNQIREIQLNGTRGRGDLDRIIRDASGKALTEEDAKYLFDQNKGIEPSEKDKHVASQMSSVRAWGETYIKTGYAGLPIGGVSKEGKQREIEQLTKEFENRVFQEDAKGSRIDEIAYEVKSEKTKRDDPSLAGHTTLSDITVDINGKVKNLFLGPKPEGGPKVKPKYILTRVEQALKPEKSKKE